MSSKNCCSNCAHSRTGAAFGAQLPLNHYLCAVEPPKVFAIPVMRQGLAGAEQAVGFQSVSPTVPAEHSCGLFLPENAAQTIAKKPV